MRNGLYKENNGWTSWYLNDELHREDGPAVESEDGHKCWYLNGRRHREDGPAIEYASGTKEWHVNGIEYTKEEFTHWLEKKALNETLQLSLEPRPKTKKPKI